MSEPVPATWVIATAEKYGQLESPSVRTIREPRTIVVEQQDEKFVHAFALESRTGAEQSSGAYQASPFVCQIHILRVTQRSVIVPSQRIPKITATTRKDTGAHAPQNRRPWP